MTVAHHTYIIIDIKEIKKAELSVMGTTVLEKPKLDTFRITAILKSFCEKSRKGLKLLEKLGHGDKLNELEMEYLDTQEAFTLTLPVNRQTLEWDKYHVGGEIMVAYYPTSVWATFHAEGEPDNNDDKKRWLNGK